MEVEVELDASVVGRIGATPVADEVDTEGNVNPDGGMQLESAAHVNPEVQQPPPRFTGHGSILLEHTSVVWRAVFVVVIVEDVIVLVTVLV